MQSNNLKILFLLVLSHIIYFIYLYRKSESYEDIGIEEYNLSAMKKLAVANTTHFWVFKNGNGTSYCHMSTIEKLPNNMLAAAFQRSAITEGMDDQSIFFTLSADQGKTWSTPVTVADYEKAVWGPVLFWDNKQQILWLFYSQSVPENRREENRSWPGGNIYYKQTTISSNFSTWTEKVLLLPYASETRGNISKVTANRLIQTSKGRWILPFWQEYKTTNDTGPQCSGVLISEDYGKKWQPYGFVMNNQSWLIENSVAELSDGRIIMVFRTTLGYIYKTFSLDGGKTWPMAVPSNLPNPNSKVSIMSIPKKNNLLVLSYNPSPKDRNPLVISKSLQAITWDLIDTLDSDSNPGNYAYPTSIEMDDKIYTTYSAEGIKLAITENY